MDPPDLIVLRSLMPHFAEVADGIADPLISRGMHEAIERLCVLKGLPYDDICESARAFVAARATPLPPPTPDEG